MGWKKSGKNSGNIKGSQGLLRHHEKGEKDHEISPRRRTGTTNLKIAAKREREASWKKLPFQEKRVART